MLYWSTLLIIVTSVQLVFGLFVTYAQLYYLKIYIYMLIVCDRPVSPMSFENGNSQC